MAAGNATIGALRVELGLNSAQFEQGLKKAQAAAERFGKAAAIGLAAVGTAAVAATVAMGVAVKGAIDHADALGKAAQKAGVTVEALSKLEYAAKYSDISLETLTGGLTKLGKTMSDVATGGNQSAKVAFEALGIKIKDASGNLRSADAVFRDISDRFSRMDDSATKSALAIRVFGKSGADLIPLLNEGTKKLKDYSDEQERLGELVTGKTANAANDFNDKMDTLGRQFDGFVQTIAKDVLPMLNDFADGLKSPAMQAAFTWIGTAVEGTIQGLVQLAAVAMKVIQQIADFVPGSPDAMQSTENLRKRMSGIDTLVTNANRVSRSGAQNTLNVMGQPLGAPDLAKLQTERGSIAGVIDKRAANSWKGLFPDSGGPAPLKDPNLPDIPAQTKAAAALQKAYESVKWAIEGTHDPLTKLHLDSDKLNMLFAKGKITAEQFGVGMKNLGKAIADELAKRFEDATSRIGSALQSLSSILESAGAEQFGIVKGLAIAGAVVQGIGAAVAAFRAGMETGNPLLAVAYAAASALATGAQIASMLATTSTSTSAPGSPSMSTPGASGGALAAPSGPVINLELKGSGFSTKDIQNLVKQLNGALSNGAKLNLQ